MNNLFEIGTRLKDSNQVFQEAYGYKWACLRFTPLLNSTEVIPTEALDFWYLLGLGMRGYIDSEFKTELRQHPLEHLAFKEGEEDEES